jgi:hypothetical protein
MRLRIAHRDRSTPPKRRVEGRLRFADRTSGSLDQSRRQAAAVL